MILRHFLFDIREERAPIFHFHQITIGNEVYLLRLTADSIARLENKLGESVFRGRESFADNLMANLLTIIWVAMLETDVHFTVEQAADLYDRYIDGGRSIEDFVREIDCLLKTAGLCIREGGGAGMCS